MRGKRRIWTDLYQVFENQAAIKLWPHASFYAMKSPDDHLLAECFAYSPIETERRQTMGTTSLLMRYEAINALGRIGRTQDGRIVVIRTVAIGDQSLPHLQILRNFAVGPQSLICENHILPMFGEFHFQDIAFGLFPRVGGTLNDAYGSWPENSVGDVTDMLLQALEGLAFLHDSNIAHRDVYRGNLLVQWHPESLIRMRPTVSHPRVYIIDFEVAIQLPSDGNGDARLVTGYPIDGSLKEETYARPLAPDFVANQPYCPFKLDVWQLGTSFADFRATIPQIDELLEDMRCSDWTKRVSAAEALHKLQEIVNGISPQALCIPPQVIEI